MRTFCAILNANLFTIVTLIILVPNTTFAVTCTRLAHKEAYFTVCNVHAQHDDIRLFHRDPDTDTLLGSFDNILALLETSPFRLQVAMNAGMYHNDRTPVGLLIQNRKEETAIVTKAGPGNFGMLPNGVFCLQDSRADVIESRAFARERPACKLATQSGPMLVIDGRLHPRFLENSASRYVRNGVGTSRDGQHVYFVISEKPINFHLFGTFFRDILNVSQALYLDGNISKFYARELNRHDRGLPMGPIIGVVEPAE